MTTEEKVVRGGEAIAGEPITRRTFIRRQSAMAAGLIVVDTMMGTRDTMAVPGDPNCNELDHETGLMTEDADCGVWEVSGGPQSGPLDAADNDCANFQDPGSPSIRYNDNDCALSDEQGNYQADNDCGQVTGGAVMSDNDCHLTDEDGDCGEQINPLGGIHEDGDSGMNP